MELAGVEPASKSLFIPVSPITVAVLTFPLQYVQQQTYCFSSFINLPLPQSFGNEVLRLSTPDPEAANYNRLTAALIRQRKLNYLQRLYLILDLTHSYGLLLQLQNSRRNRYNPG